MEWLTICPDVSTTRASRRSRRRTCWASVAGAVLLAILVRRSRDFTTATLSLMAVAIAINVTVGSLTALLRLPLYLDSVGTVLVGALAGPWAGALTGLLSNLVWSLLPIPGGAGPATAFFAPVAATVGLLAGFWASRGVFEPSVRRRSDRRVPRPRARDRCGGHRDARRPVDRRAWVRCRRIRTRSFASPSSGSPSSPSGSSRRGRAGERSSGCAVTIRGSGATSSRPRRSRPPCWSLPSSASSSHQMAISRRWSGRSGSPTAFGLWHRGSARSRHRGSLAFAWAGRGDHARLFPVWVGGFTTGIVAACIAAPIAAGAFGGVTGGGTDSSSPSFGRWGSASSSRSWPRA